MGKASSAPVAPGEREVRVAGKVLCTALQLEDGFWYFHQWRGSGGVVDAWVLRAIADHLDELNADWNARIAADPAVNGSADVRRE